MKKYYKIANFNYSVEGNGKLADAFFSYFSASGIPESTVLNATDFSLMITENTNEFNSWTKPFLSNFSLSGSLGFSSNIYLKNCGSYSFAVKNLFVNEPVQLLVYSPCKKRIYNKATRMAKRVIADNRLFTIYDSIVERVMNYSCFWYIFSMAVLKRKLSFLHGGILSYKDHGIVLTGTGGCGKTSIAFKMMEKSDFCKYVVDDFCLVGADGYAYANPKPYTIYHSDAKWGYKSIDHYIAYKMPKRVKRYWKLASLLGFNSYCRIHRTEMFQHDQLENAVKITEVYFLARSADDRIRVSPISIDSLAARCAAASFRELKELYEMLTNIHAVSTVDSTAFPALGSIYSMFLSIYREAFKNAALHLVELPLKVSPDEVIEELHIFS